MSKTDAITEVFVRSRDLLASIIGRIVPTDDVDDLVQETYVKTLKFSNKSTIDKPRSFICRTAKNLALDHIQSARMRLNDSLDDPDINHHEAHSSTPELIEEIELQERFLMYAAAIRELPNQCRKVFILKKVYGYTQKEIAEQLGLSPRTVEKHISNGMRKCLQTFEEYEINQDTQNETASVEKIRSCNENGK